MQGAIGNISQEGYDIIEKYRESKKEFSIKGQDFVCVESSQFDLAYMSEFDPTWKNDKLQVLLSNKILLFGNPQYQESHVQQIASPLI